MPAQNLASRHVSICLVLTCNSSRHLFAVPTGRLHTVPQGQAAVPVVGEHGGAVLGPAGDDDVVSRALHVAAHHQRLVQRELDGRA